MGEEVEPEMTERTYLIDKTWASCRFESSLFFEFLPGLVVFLALVLSVGSLALALQLFISGPWPCLLYPWPWSWPCASSPC